MAEADRDVEFMKRALSLARKGLGKNFPNPLVGALVVSGGEVVAEGHYAGPGSMHAEASALAAAGDRAKGSTLYINLEPCCHRGMTPPCVDAIISSGVSRVVFSHYDPDPRVGGRGAGILRSYGIDVEVGILSREAVELNLPYIHNRLARRTFVVLKLASTLDGRITLGGRKYITCERTREYVHYLRTWTQAIGIGIETLLVDKPRLDRRLFRGDVGTPVRVVFDYGCRFPEEYPWLMDGEETIIFCRENCEEARRRKLEDSGARVIPVPGSDGRVDLQAAVDALYRENITSILIEGGARIFESFVVGSLFDRMVITYAPCFGGGKELPFLSIPPPADGSVGRGLVLKDVMKFEDDFAVVYDRGYLSEYEEMLTGENFAGLYSRG